MTDQPPNQQDNHPRPQDDLIDEDLQRELEEALGDMNMEDILAADEKQHKAAKATEESPVGKGVRKGVVLAVRDDDVFMDMGGKSQGVLPLTQLDHVPKEGDVLEVVIAGYDRQEGLLLLSRQGAVQAAAWETLDEGQLVEGRVTGFNKGGLELTINGIRAFMPISQIELFRIDDLSPYVDQRLRCQVSEIDRAEQNVIVSRRSMLELEAEQAREKMFAELAEGQTVMGVVRSIMPYGAFVDIGGVDGLLHISDMSYSRVEDPHQAVKEGQQLKLQVLKVDRESRRISLGLKQVLPDPWKDAEIKWPADSVISGRVTRLADFGAFVELESGVEGLIPIGELSFERRLKHPSEVINAGDVVKVRVLSVDLERKRISLSLKRVGDDPWTGATVRWPANGIVTGIVTRVTEFGAFVELVPGVEGLVHISQISHDRIRSVGDVLKEGDRVQAKVVAVDEEKRRISLSIKDLASLAQYTGPQAAEAPQPAAPAKKRTKPLKGGLD